MHRRSWVSPVVLSVVLLAATINKQCKAAVVLDLTQAASDPTAVDGAMFGVARGMAQGTGIEFLRVQGTSTEGDEAAFNSTSLGKTLLFGQLLQVPIGDASYLQFGLKADEPSGSKSTILLTALKLFVTNSPAATSISGLGSPVYDLDAGLDRSVLINDSTNGNSKFDLIVNIPAGVFGTNAGKYVTLYSAFGSASGGPEKWSALVVPEPACAGALAFAALLLTRKRM
jgi:hypothetical protein